MQIHPDWLVPDWPAPTRIKAVFTTRAGGVSQPPYDHLNLGDHVGDDSNDVAINRARLAQALGVQPVYLQQVHGTVLVRLPTPEEHNTKQLACADAVMTEQTHQVGTIMVADCLAVLLTNRAGGFVAAVHAGWRGLAGGVLRQTIQQISALHASDIIAWLGPCIGPSAFEVGPEVREAFVSQEPRAAAHFYAQTSQSVHVPQKYLADLAALARDELRDLGVTTFGNDSSAPWCTVLNPSRFFSHRRDRISGRMAACIWMV
jgi:YfiH family protein